MSLEKLSSPNGFQAGWSADTIEAEVGPGGADAGADAGSTAGTGVLGGALLP